MSLRMIHVSLRPVYRYKVIPSPIEGILHCIPDERVGFERRITFMSLRKISVSPQPVCRYKVISLAIASISEYIADERA